MFNFLPTIKRFSNNRIDLKDLHKIVSNNPQKNIINKLRTLEYKSKEYNSLKLKLSAILPHGIFSSLDTKGLISFSNYFFFDIDGIDTIDELNDTIKRLNDTFPIAFLQRSVSMKGFHFLIKVDDTLLLPNDTIMFEVIHSYIFKLLTDAGFSLDNGAKGICRKMIISSDEDCIVNDVKMIIDIDDVKRHQEELRSLNKLREKREYVITPNDTFSNDIIPIKELLKQINTQTVYTKEITGEFVIDDMEHYTILIPERIKDGTKHKLYARIVNALYFINGNITRTQVYSYLYYINNRATPRMTDILLRRYITYLCDSIEQYGIRIKPRIKRLHFNKDANFTKKEKQIMGAKLTGQIKTNKTLDRINQARMECAKLNEVPTQKRIAELTGLGIATVKRNWNKDIVDLKDMTLEVIKTPEVKENLPIIDENEFFNDGIEVEFKYKGYETVKIKITTKDKEDFKDALNRLKTMNFEVCYSTLELCGLDKYKMDYLYQIWAKKQNK